jgi:hypothetical protein
MSGTFPGGTPSVHTYTTIVFDPNLYTPVTFKEHADERKIDK